MLSDAIMSLRRFGPAVMLLGTLACQYDPYTFSYTTVKPDVQFVIGSWVATEDTLRSLAHGPYESAHPSIMVHDDGTIEMKDIPDTWRSPFGEGSGKVEEFTGKWKLYKHQDSWWGLQLTEADWGCSGCLMLVGSKPPYTLVIRYGDPDSGDGYEFRKAA